MKGYCGVGHAGGLVDRSEMNEREGKPLRLEHLVEHVATGARDRLGRYLRRESGRRTPAISTLRTKTRKAWELTHAGRYTELADLLRSLVPDLETAARSAPEEQRPEVCELLATTYQACSAALAKLGEPEAAWIAAEQSD